MEQTCRFSRTAVLLMKFRGFNLGEACTIRRWRLVPPGTEASSQERPPRSFQHHGPSGCGVFVATTAAESQVRPLPPVQNVRSLGTPSKDEHLGLTQRLVQVPL